MCEGVSHCGFNSNFLVTNDIGDLTVFITCIWEMFKLLPPFSRIVCDGLVGIPFYLEESALVTRGKPSLPFFRLWFHVQNNLDTDETQYLSLVHYTFGGGTITFPI